MFIGRFVVFRPNKKTRGVRRVQFIMLECDTCKSSISRALSHFNPNVLSHYCNRKCADKAQVTGGKIRDATNDTFAIRDPKREKTQATYRATCIEKYGVDHSSKVPEIQNYIRIATNEAMQNGGTSRSKAAVFEKHGVTSTFSLPEVRDKITVTLVERYGVTCAWQTPNCRAAQQSDETRLKQKETMSQWSDEFLHQRLEKARATTFERFGFAHSSFVPEILERTRKTNIERYGVPCTLLLQPKGIQKSKGEILLGDKLCEMWGIENVSRQVLMNERWLIDIYVKPIDTYVQYDGIYWHGHNRPLEKILEFKSSQDRGIYRKMQTDVEQNEWFNESNLKLVRVDEREFRKSLKNKTLDEFLLRLKLFT